MDPIVITVVTAIAIGIMLWIRWRGGQAVMKTLEPKQDPSYIGSLPPALPTGSDQLLPSPPNSQDPTGSFQSAESPIQIEAWLDEMQQRDQASLLPEARAHFDKIEALKQHMKATGGSLSDALRHFEGDKIPAQLSVRLEHEIRAYLQQGQKIQAIKHLRKATGSSLQEALERINQLAQHL
jgi:ribosomal protein L7/L12